LGLPQPIDVVVAASTAFAKLHANCKEGGFSEPVATSPQDWVNGRDTGISSLAIWAVAMDRPSPASSYDTPHDASDFGRCYRLLKQFPKFLSVLPSIAAQYPKWKPFVREWATLTKLYEDGLNAVEAEKHPHRVLYEIIMKLEKEP
jgi:hypothetical protein